MFFNSKKAVAENEVCNIMVKVTYHLNLTAASSLHTYFTYSVGSCRDKVHFVIATCLFLSRISLKKFWHFLEAEGS